MKKKKRAKVSTKSNKKQSSNRQGTKYKIDGIQFKSKLEAYCHTKLKEAGITAKYESKTFELLPEIEFKYNDKTSKRILPLTYTPDFVGSDFIIECKGYADTRFKNILQSA